jgi:hypothetical protein
MSRPFNPQIRKLTRLVLEIPPEAPLPDCSWPLNNKECDLKSSRLIESSMNPETDERYEVRSIDDRKECSLGPEVINALKNPGYRATILERLADMEIEMNNLPALERGSFVKKVDEDIQTEMNRRSRIIFSYFIYFTIALLFLTDHSRKTNSWPIVIISIVPLITMFFLHQMYSERVANSTFVHLIPILLLVSFGLFSWTMDAGGSPMLSKPVLGLSILITVFFSIKLVMGFRDIYSMCASQQRGMAVDVTKYITLGVLGLIIPMIILLSLYLL